MATNPRPILDATDHSILEQLQRDGRISVADLARAINLSASATAERLRRLTDTGVITGYSATLDPEALGYAVTAFVRLAYPRATTSRSTTCWRSPPRSSRPTTSPVTTASS